MKTLILMLRMLYASLAVLFRRATGRKKFSSWSLTTEMIWATTRTTLMSSLGLGIEWLKSFSSSMTTKPKLASNVNIEERTNTVGRYLKVTPKDPSRQRNLNIIYFHGGGYVMGSPKASLEFLTRLSLQSGATIVAPFYPLGPEYTYPAAHEFAERFVAEFLTVIDLRTVVISGDSAGGALALTSLRSIDTGTLQKIGGCVLISPWIEPLADGGSITENAQNDVGNREFVVACYKEYVAGAGEQLAHPLDYSSVDFVYFCPTLVTVGSAEILLDQSKRLAERISTSGAEVEVRVYKDMFHTFWNMAPLVPESLTIVDDISMWVKRLS